MRVPVIVALALAVLAGVAGAAERPPRDDPAARDLTATIALQGKPCGQVVGVARRGDNDYVATCADGHRYRVYVKDGRVVVEKG